VCGGPASQWVGRGTGVDDTALEVKTSVVDAAARRAAGLPPLDALREVGGAELVAVAAALLRARERSIPVVLDGYVITAAAAALAAAVAGALEHCIAGHLSPEPGHALLLERLGLQPLLDLSLRLGEGTGALLAVPLVRLAAASVVEVATFAEWGMG
jgi:nicotinate-nucleotide--dimethylbenzimidazole phosphoribosyltransferase